MVKIVDPEFDNASYIDPRGRVFYKDGQVFRAFSPAASSFYQEFLSLDKTISLLNQGRIIETELAPDIEVDGFGLVVRQRKVPNVNYYFEWSANMLKDAALLTIDLALDFNEDNIILQDATPYNILFDSTKPIFIDLCSFAPEISGYLWSAYQQFCNFFLFPLYLFACGDSQLTTQLIKNCDDGISVDIVIRIMSFLDKVMTPGYFSRVFLPKTISRTIKIPSNQNKIRKFLSYLIEKKKITELQQIRRKFFMGLLKDILNLNFSYKNEEMWGNYYQQTKQDTLQKKLRLVDSVTKDLNPKTVLDIGCNRGEFSILVAQAGARVIAFDTDRYCIDMLYKEAKSKNLTILPLVMDILNPTPAMGWRGIQVKNAQERFKSDMVYALAIMHHLVFSRGLDFTRSIQSIRDFCNKWLIIEYISANDPLIELLPHRPSLDYAWYTQDNFLRILSRYFSEVNVLGKISDTRILIIAKV